MYDYSLFLFQIKRARQGWTKRCRPIRLNESRNFTRCRCT